MQFDLHLTLIMRTYDQTLIIQNIISCMFSFTVPSSSDFLDNSGVVYSSLLPLTVVLIVILLCILSSLLLYIKKRKRGEILTGDSGDEDNKRNLNQREQYYAAALQTTTTTTPISQQGTLGYDLYENDATRWDFPAKSNSFQNKNSGEIEE